MKEQSRGKERKAFAPDLECLLTPHCTCCLPSAARSPQTRRPTSTGTVRKASACRSAAMSAAHVESALQSDKAPSNLAPRLASLAAAMLQALPVSFWHPIRQGKERATPLQARAGAQRPLNLATVACGSQLTAASATVISSTKGR